MALLVLHPRRTCRRRRELLTRKVLNLGADDADAALVGGVELEDAGAVELGAEELLGEGQYGGGFAGTWGPVEEEVGKVGCGESALEEVCGMRLGGYVCECFGSAVRTFKVS